MTESRRPEDLWAAFDFPRHPLAREDGERLRGAFYEAPAQWLRAFTPQQLPGVLNAAHAAAREGAWVLGGLRYEAAGALDAALQTQAGAAALAEFAVYRCEPQAWPAAQACHTGYMGWQDSQDDASEAAQIERIREWIRAGDCYQVNLTTRIHATVDQPLDAAQRFLALHAAQPDGFSLFLREAGVASVSPELFFDWRPVPDSERSWLLAAQPMKGTAPRGADAVADEAAQAYLRTSEKERAENLMIVDLLRNDIGRVASLGTVRVPRLFELHALPTVWQMTSTVTAVSRPGLSLADIFAALFPCGSVTGAPKVRAMQIIKELEPAPRGWYCGALGVLQPGGVATFNVPIRTVEQVQGRWQCGMGSAITLDSSPPAEIAEWRAKMRFLLRAEAPIAALETLLLAAGQWSRLNGHLARLQRTAQHFGIKYSQARLRELLARIAEDHATGSWRVRLTLGQGGVFDSRVEPLPPTPAALKLALAEQPIDSLGPSAEFIQHKTTRRESYDALTRSKPPEAFDLLLWNTDGELTECSFGNIALLIDNRWLTPRREAGLLSGVLREELLAQGRLHEAPLFKRDLARASALAFFNSLRGWHPAELLNPQPGEAAQPAD